jgi:hypothetical protein
MALRLALERADAQRTALVGLIGTLYGQNVLNASAVNRSFEKMMCMWEDLAIDSPKAPQHILFMVKQCVDADVLGEGFYAKLPENLIKAGLGSGEAEPVKEVLQKVADDLKEFKRRVGPCLDDFFHSQKGNEVITFLKDLGMKAYHHEFVKKAMVLSFSQTDTSKSREAVARLFKDLVDVAVLCEDDLFWGITRLLGQIDELVLDTPKCVELTTDMLCAFVSMDLLSALFLRRCRFLRIGGPTGLKVLDLTQRRTPEHSKRNLDTAQFKREIQTMILEYFTNGDEVEFGRCVSDLAPLSQDQSAELLRKVMSLAMERSGEECMAAMKIMAFLRRNEEIDEWAVERAMDNLYERMPDISLDVPDAKDMAASFVVEAQNEGLLRPDWQIPT